MSHDEDIDCEDEINRTIAQGKAIIAQAAAILEESNAAIELAEKASIKLAGKGSLERYGLEDLKDYKRGAPMRPLEQRTPADPAESHKKSRLSKIIAKRARVRI